MKKRLLSSGIIRATISKVTPATALCPQEEMIPFFQAMTLSKECTTAETCMVEMAEKVRKGLGPIDPYFVKLADGMLAWIACWQQLNKKE